MALDAGIHRHVADVVPIDPQRQFLVERQGMKAGVLGEGAVDQGLRHAVIGDVEEADRLGDVAQLGRDVLERAGLAGPVVAEIEHRDAVERRTGVHCEQSSGLAHDLVSSANWSSNQSVT